MRHLNLLRPILFTVALASVISGAIAADTTPSGITSGAKYSVGGSPGALVCSLIDRNGHWYSINDSGKESRIEFRTKDDATILVALDWQNIEGLIDQNDHTIHWSNGTTWCASDCLYWRKMYMSGNRTINPTFLHIDGKHQAYANNERHQQSRIRWKSPTEIEAIDWKITGKLKTDGNRLTNGIHWSNGTFWATEWFEAIFYAGNRNPQFKLEDNKSIAVDGSGGKSALRWAAPDRVVAIDWQNLGGRVTDNTVVWDNSSIWHLSRRGEVLSSRGEGVVVVSIKNVYCEAITTKEGVVFGTPADELYFLVESNGKQRRLGGEDNRDILEFKPGTRKDINQKYEAHEDVYSAVLKKGEKVRVILTVGEQEGKVRIDHFFVRFTDGDQQKVEGFIEGAIDPGDETLGSLIIELSNVDGMVTAKTKAGKNSSLSRDWFFSNDVLTVTGGGAKYHVALSAAHYQGGEFKHVELCRP